MSNQNSEIAKWVREVWSREFSFLERIDLIETPRLPKGRNYRYGPGKAGLFYFVRLEFSPKRPGEISIGLAISDSPNRSMLNPSSESKPSPTSIGSFGIWQFPGVATRAWSLIDLEAERERLFGLGMGLPRSGRIWRPSSFGKSLQEITEEALLDINSNLKKFVFPALRIPN